MSIYKSIIAHYYGAIYKLLYGWWNYSNKHSKFHCDVLMFHHVSDQYVDEIPSCKRTRYEFCNTIQKRIAKGIHFINMDAVRNLVYNGGVGNYATVTFDDVPESFISEAYPILQKLQIPFTLFITTSYLETPGYIQKDELRQLSKDSLCTIGAHTMTHPMLRKISNSYEEIVESKRKLENIIGRKIKYFAYPYGRPSSVSCKVTKFAKKAGFDMAFGTVLLPINDTSKRFKYYLPRVID